MALGRERRLQLGQGGVARAAKLGQDEIGLSFDRRRSMIAALSLEP
jgi:hypothetical protein